MAELPKWAAGAVRSLKLVGMVATGVVGTGAALGAVWTVADLPIPATRQWVAERDSARSRISRISIEATRLRKGIEAIPTGDDVSDEEREAREALVASLEAYESEVRDLCRFFTREERPALCPSEDRR